MALLESPAAEVNALRGGDCMEHIAATKGSLFQALQCIGQMHYEESSTVLPGSFPNGVNACFDL